MVPQDIAIIMGYVDPPQLGTNVQAQGEVAKLGLKPEQDQSAAPKIHVESDDDIASSGGESEDEVEAQIDLVPEPEADDNLNESVAIVKLEESSADSSDTDSASSSGPTASSRRLVGKYRPRSSPPLNVDVEEDGPPRFSAHITTAHELPPTAVPVPPLPDPSTLPPDPLEYIGEIAKVLPDSIVVRGAGPSDVGHLSSRDRRDAALDEGSLLLFEDRTVLGYVWETFGPTALPHYVVRINRSGDSTRTKSSVSPSTHDKPADLDEVQLASSEVTSTESMSESRPRPDGPDLSKLLVTQSVYHIPSLSNFVFPRALARLKGSDASNFYDEEPADHELEFSDDEAEATRIDLPDLSSSRAPSCVPSTAHFVEEDAMSAVGGTHDASSLYGASPYDIDDAEISHDQDIIPSSPNSAMHLSGSSSLTRFEDAATREALLIARNSRNRRPKSASVSDALPIPGPSQPRNVDVVTNGHGRGRGRGRGRGKNRVRHDRVRDQGYRGQPRGRTHGRGRDHPHGTTPEEGHVRLPPPPQHRRSSFSFEEYDPRMPRLPSPASLAIAHATGQWTDGTPFPYAGGVDLVNVNAQQPSNGSQSLQAIQSPGYGQIPHQSHGYYGPPFHFSQAGDQQSQYQNSPATPYGVAPHINPRFSQVLGLSGAPNLAPVVQPAAPPPTSLDLSNLQSQQSEMPSGGFPDSRPTE